jgi:hypothetical protein
MPLRNRIAVDLGSGCGMRQGEILGFSDTDIDTCRKMIRVDRQIKSWEGDSFSPNRKDAKPER